MLKFHQEIVSQCLRFDGLWILARGLGVFEIIENLLSQLVNPENNNAKPDKNSNNTTSSPKNSDSLLPPPRGNIIVLNLHPECLPNASPRKYPYVNSEYNAQQRKALYLKGGIIFGTSFVLIVDLLKKRLPPHLISGFIVANAEHITETSTEVFILRYYRQVNKNGFIKAFSDNPIAFTNGFHKVEKVMKCLYLTKLFLWPRFHQIVKESLEDPNHLPEVLEFKSDMTPNMDEIHKSIIAVMNACIKELQRISSV
jgi:DNA excision repair protein ERCC-4